MMSLESVTFQFLDCRSQGPSFKMAEPPQRELIALALAEKVGEKNRDQKKRALEAQRRQFSSYDLIFCHNLNFY